jgi:hypothetical protein
MRVRLRQSTRTGPFLDTLFAHLFVFAKHALKAGWDNRYLLHVLGGVNEMRLPGIIVYIVGFSPEKWYTRMNIAKGSLEQLQPLEQET